MHICLPNFGSKQRHATVPASCKHSGSTSSPAETELRQVGGQPGSLRLILSSTPRPETRAARAHTRPRLERQRPTAILPPPRASNTTSIAWWNLPSAPAGKHARTPRPRNRSSWPGCLPSASSPASGGGSASCPGDPAELPAEHPIGQRRRRDEETMRAVSSSALQTESSIVHAL